MSRPWPRRSGQVSRHQRQPRPWCEARRLSRGRRADRQPQYSLRRPAARVQRRRRAASCRRFRVNPAGSTATLGRCDVLSEVPSLGEGDRRRALHVRRSPLGRTGRRRGPDHRRADAPPRVRPLVPERFRAVPRGRAGSDIRRASGHLFGDSRHVTTGQNAALRRRVGLPALQRRVSPDFLIAARCARAGPAGRQKRESQLDCLSRRRVAIQQGLHSYLKARPLGRPRRQARCCRSMRPNW